MNAPTGRLINPHSLIFSGFRRKAVGHYELDAVTHKVLLVYLNGFWYPSIIQPPEMSHEEEQQVSIQRITHMGHVKNLVACVSPQHALLIRLY